MKLNGTFVWAAAAAAAAALTAIDARAQCGGMRSRPAFRPTGVVTRGPAPSPVPTPTPTPRNPNDPTPRTPSGGGVTPATPLPAPGTTSGGVPLSSTGEFDWVGWWDANQWRYLEFHAIAGETRSGDFDLGAASSGNDAAAPTPGAIASIVAALRDAAGSSDPLVAGDALAALASVAGPEATADVGRVARTSGRSQLGAILAASRIPEAGGAALVRPLVEQAGTPALHRGAAAVSLGMSGEAAGSFALLRELFTVAKEPLEVRVGAAVALAVSGGHDAIAVLAGVLAGEREAPRIRAVAAFALGRTGDRCAVRPLADALAGAEDESVRRAAASSLGAIALRHGHPLDAEARREAVDTLIGAIRDDERLPVRAIAVLSLGQVGSADGKLECRRILTEGPAELVAPALVALGILGDASDAPLVAAYLAKDSEHRAPAALACGLLRHAAAAPVIRELLVAEKGDAVAYRMAATAAGLLGDSGAIPLLAERSADPSGQLSEPAILGLGLLGHVSARDAVRRAADEARGDRPRATALEVLGRMRDAGSRYRLEAALAASSRSSLEKAAAARALGLLGSPARALTPIEDVMCDRDPALRMPLVEKLVARL